MCGPLLSHIFLWCISCGNQIITISKSQKNISDVLNFGLVFSDPRDDPFIDQEDPIENESDEEEASESEEEEIEEPKPAKKTRRPRGSLLTGRGVTMQMLIDENILQAGEKLLSIDYLVSNISLKGEMTG